MKRKQKMNFNKDYIHSLNNTEGVSNEKEEIPISLKLTNFIIGPRLTNIILTSKEISIIPNNILIKIVDDYKKELEDYIKQKIINKLSYHDLEFMNSIRIKGIKIEDPIKIDKVNYLEKYKDYYPILSKINYSDLKEDLSNLKNENISIKKLADKYNVSKTSMYRAKTEILDYKYLSCSRINIKNNNELS